MRLIDADALLYHLSDYQLQESPWWGANGYGNADAYEAITECMKAIEDAPTIEPERKTGRWVKPTGMMPPEHHGHYECSICGAWAGRNWLRPWKEVQLSSFCPNCGAKMTEGEG